MTEQDYRYEQDLYIDGLESELRAARRHVQDVLRVIESFKLQHLNALVADDQEAERRTLDVLARNYDELETLRGTILWASERLAEAQGYLAVGL